MKESRNFPVREKGFILEVIRAEGIFWPKHSISVSTNGSVKYVSDHFLVRISLILRSI